MSDNSGGCFGRLQAGWINLLLAFYSVEYSIQTGWKEKIKMHLMY
jgi:hypothetical protein